MQSWKQNAVACFKPHRPIWQKKLATFDVWLGLMLSTYNMEVSVMTAK